MGTSLFSILMTIFLICAAMMITLVFFFYLFFKKERLKEKKEITQEFILPYLNEVILYIAKKTDYRKEHGIELIVVNSDEIIKKIQGKIRYGNARLVKSVSRYYRAVSYFNGNGQAKNISTYEVFYDYLDYAYQCIEKSDFKDDELLDVILKNQKIYGITFVLTTILGEEEALNIISLEWLWTTDFLNKISVSLLEDLINNYNNSSTEEYKLLYLLSTLKSDFAEYPEIERAPHLRGYLEEAIDIVKNRWVNYSN